MSYLHNQRKQAKQMLGLALATAMLTSLFAATSYSTTRIPASAAATTGVLPWSGSGLPSSPAVQGSPQSFNRWRSNGPDGGFVSSLAIDPANPGTIYAGTSEGVFKSTNGGGNWNSSVAKDYVSGLAIDPKTPMTLYAASEDGVSKSTNGGTSWSVISSFQHVTAVGIDPTNPNIIYAASIFDGVFKSTNSGGTWFSIGLSETQPSELAIDPINPNTIYVAGKSGPPQYFDIVCKSTDGGQTWSSSHPNSYSGSVNALAIDPTNPNIIYAGLPRGDGDTGGVYKSTDGAKSWSAFNNGLTPGHGGAAALAIDSSNPNIIYAGTAKGLFKSTNGAASWSETDSDIANPDVAALVIDPLNSAITYAGTAGGIFKSTSGGASWSAANTSLRSLYVQTMVVDPGNANTIYAGTSGSGLFKSTDNGESWRRLENGLTSRDIYALAIDPQNPAIIYLGADRLYKSANGGESWSASAGIGDITALAIDPKDTNIIYAASANGAFKSSNAGGSWSAVGNLFLAFTYPTLLVIDPHDSRTIYSAGTYYCDLADFCNTTVFKSTDGSTSWKRSDAGLSSSYVFALVIDPINTATLYVSVYSEGAGDSLYKSTDSGGTWSASGTGLANSGVSSLVINPVNPNIIYAGTYGNGVFMSADGGASWNPLNDGLTNLKINTLTIDASGNFLHAGTYAGVFEYEFINSIDNAQSFVRQHYRDFLNREADPAGLAFWADNINKCISPARRPAPQTETECTDKQKETTSAAFFLSPEFQYTGYFVYRLYKGSLIQNGAGRFPTYQEFLRDVRQVANGIIQNNQLAASIVEANKKRFAEEFTQRAEFRSLYDPLSNFDYVERLFQTTGINVSAAEKQALVDGLNNQTETRASVLQKVVDGAVVIAEGNQQFTTTYGKAFYDKEFNAAFVLMEYFGYLRRDPDPAGYQNWLDKLNTYGNYIDAEMVRSFIISPEYRARFGPALARS